MPFLKTIKLSYAPRPIGCGGFLYAYILYSALITYYFTDVLGITAAATGTLLLVSRIWDGINDPMMGAFIDRTNTKWGKCRPYILAGGIWLAVSSALLFTNPGIQSNAGKLVWAYVIYNSFGMAYTMYCISLKTLTRRITTTRQEIISVNSYGFAGTSIASIIFSSLLMTIIGWFSTNGDVSKGYQWSGVLAGALILITMWAFFSLKENTFEDEVSNGNREKKSVWTAFKYMLKNKSYMGFCLGSMIGYFGYYLSASTMMYYCVYSLGKAEYFSVLNTIDYATPIIAAILMPYITKRFEKKTVIVVGTLLAAFAYGMRFVTGDPNLFVMVVLALLAGTGLGLWNVLFTPVCLDCAVQGEYESGMRSDALYVSSLSLLQKVCTGLGGATVGYVLAAVGYVANAESQSARAMSAIKFCALAGAAITCLVTAVIFVLFYKLNNRKIEEMNKAILERSTAAE